MHLKYRRRVAEDYGKGVHLNPGKDNRSPGRSNPVQSVVIKSILHPIRNTLPIVKHVATVTTLTMGIVSAFLRYWTRKRRKELSLIPSTGRTEVLSIIAKEAKPHITVDPAV